jgi:hypothetical protein
LPFSSPIEVIGEFFGTRTASWSPLVVRAPMISMPSPPEAAKTGGASPTPPTSTDPDDMACSIGGPEVKSDQLAWNGSVSSSPAAVSSACAPVPFWSPMFSVTEDRFTALEVGVPEAAEDADEVDEEQPAAASPASAIAMAA